ncbi:MAG: phosphotransferase family protein [Nocardioides sp.]
MSTAPTTVGGALWSDVLPPGREYVVLPPGRDPVVVAERDSGVLSYVRRSLLALPPRTGLPPAAERATLAAASQLLRVPAAWGLLSRLSSPTPRGAPDGGLDAWLSPGERRVLVLHHSRDVAAGVVMLLFDRGTSRPAVALKIADSEPGRERIRREKERLRRIRALSLGPVLNSIPAPLPDRDSRFAVLATAGQAGVPMLVAYHRPGHTRTVPAVGADLDAAGVWLAGLQHTVTGAPEPLTVHQSCEAAACAVLDGSVPRLEQVLQALGALRGRMARRTAVQTVVHGDFWPGNTLTDGQRITGVVDWELSEPSGSPVRDLARFAVAYSLYLDRHTAGGRPVRGHAGLRAGAPGAGVLYAADGAGWYPELVRRYLRDGLRRLGVPESAGRDAMQAEVAANAAEASEPAFARAQWALFLALERTRS